MYSIFLTVVIGCSGNPCHGGNCTAPGDPHSKNYTCICNPDTTGEHCESRILFVLCCTKFVTTLVHGRLCSRIL